MKVPLSLNTNYVMGATRGNMGASSEELELRLMDSPQETSPRRISPGSKQRPVAPEADLQTKGDIDILATFAKDFQESDSGPIPEAAFLKFCLSLEDLDEVKEALSDRLSCISHQDFAAEYSQLRARDIALKRTPAIMMTLTLELFVGLVIARFSPLLRRVRLFYVTPSCNEPLSDAM